jgi:peptide/nickel transport system permease protein
VLKYIVRRLLVLPVIMFLVTLILFFLILQVPPEQRAAVYVPSANPHLTESQYQELVQTTIERYGLDRPLWIQYTEWLGNLLRGEWGYSPSSREPVLTGLRRRAPATLELTLFSMIPAIILAVILGSLSARRNMRVPDQGVRVATFIGWAFPPFILALILMNVFYAWLGWFPPERLSVSVSPIVNSDQFHNFTGLVTVDAVLNANFEVFGDAVRHLVLPALSLGVILWALLTRIMRSSLVDVMRRDYITTARAKGVSERHVVNDHARRNAILPLISAAGVAASMLVTWIVVIETVFNYNGIGRWVVRGILHSDLPVAVGFALFTCILVVLASLIADIFYAIVDPRVRLF